ncbi:hypothetical protein LPTSP2_36590 [Leptospira ellinghausenii]|uniref:Uncharacterized protein n=1 Tax=Leptospira ellinghausenii TaxID=1917822 RepID=A0A2P2DI87_9LEPT|nr:hypothetical protein [Leptospira ellinghausenii]GBF44356.1 hypothetical protein LPTSP2_36590 [Leptospira ellinghausenii]
MLPNRLETKKILKQEKCGDFNYVFSDNSDFRIRRESKFSISYDGLFDAIDECTNKKSKKTIIVTITLEDKSNQNSQMARVFTSLPFVTGSFFILPMTVDTELDIKFDNLYKFRSLVVHRKVFKVGSPLYSLFRWNFQTNSENAKAIYYEHMKNAILRFENREKIYED